MKKPHFTIKNKFQKRSELYEDILTKDILTDVCKRITGKTEFTSTFDNDGYNKGRLAILQYKEKIYFITFSDTESAGRNASMQSVPSALLGYYEEKNPNKEIYFYFLPSSGNNETDYFYFIYRLMLTAGIKFLNHCEYLKKEIRPFVSAEDMILTRNYNKGRNKSNNSSFITIGNNHVIQVYGKTYGANKYETTLFCIALSRISRKNKIELYEICEQELSNIPKRNADVLNSLGNVKIIPTNLFMERKDFEQSENLRSPRFIYNLLAKLGSKKCALCECEIPELIEGAHIWPVAAIKQKADINLDDKIKYATDGDNGIWLCENHHKMLDENIIKIDISGAILTHIRMKGSNANFIERSTTIKRLIPKIMTTKFIFYLRKRYEKYI